MALKSLKTLKSVSKASKAPKKVAKVEEEVLEEEELLEEEVLEDEEEEETEDDVEDEDEDDVEEDDEDEDDVEEDDVEEEEEAPKKATPKKTVKVAPKKATPKVASKTTSKTTSKSAPKKATPKKATSKVAPAEKTASSLFSTKSAAKPLSEGATMSRDAFIEAVASRITATTGSVPSKKEVGELLSIVEDTMVEDVFPLYSLNFATAKFKRKVMPSRVYSGAGGLSVDVAHDTEVSEHIKVTASIYLGKESRKGTLDEDGEFTPLD